MKNEAGGGNLSTLERRAATLRQREGRRGEAKRDAEGFSV